MVNLCLQPPTVNPSSFPERERERETGRRSLLLLLPLSRTFSPPYFHICLLFQLSSVFSRPYDFVSIRLRALARVPRRQTTCRAPPLYRANSLNKQNGNETRPSASLFYILYTRETLQATTPGHTRLSKRIFRGVKRRKDEKK